MVQPGGFAFVSNFESGTLEGWGSISGTTPTATTTTTFGGEPSLQSTAGSNKPQIDLATGVIAPGESFLSVQVAINAESGSGYFGLADAQHAPVAVIGVSGGEVFAGTNPETASAIEPVPGGTAYPAGWVYLTANLFNTSTKSEVSWSMQLFVDRADQAPATVPLPMAWNYASALIETTSGTVYYTNIIVTTSAIPRYIPGYNNMMGYGQGSGGNTELLPAYTKLTAEMTVNSWNTPQTGILSFQINALNFYGTTRSSCVGFYQLGIDLNPGGLIAPWWVNGRNCIAHYFVHSMNAHILPGIASPAGTHLLLTIEDNVTVGMIEFQIVDTSVTPWAYFNASVPYAGTPFYGMYTQMEFQPCCNSSPIQDYRLDASLYNLRTVPMATGAPTPLPASYMIPFFLDAPPTWTYTYYQDALAGYHQLA